MPQRQDLHEGLRPSGQLRDRVERAAEQEQRDDDEPVHCREGVIVLLLRGERHQRHGERHPRQRGDEHTRDQAPIPRLGEECQHCSHAAGRDRAPRCHPQGVAADDVGGPQRSRRDPVVRTLPDEAAHDRPQALVGRQRHRRGDHQRRGDVGDVRGAAEQISRPRCAIDERADTDAETEQVEQRLDDRGEGVADPQPAEDRGVPERDAHRTGCCDGHR